MRWTDQGSAVVRDSTLTWATTVVAARTGGTGQGAVVRNWPTHLAWWEPSFHDAFDVLLCRREGLFRLAAGDSADAVRLLDALVTGATRPGEEDRILPAQLHSFQVVGRDSTARTDLLHAWYVERARVPSEELAGLGSAGADSLYELTYRTLPDHQSVEFLPGLGITRYRYAHHGTVAQAEATLVRFSPGRSP